MAACASPSIADEALRATDKKANFQRLTRLLMCGGVTLLREVFDSIHPPANLPVKLNDPATKMQLQGAKLTKPEWDCVYPSPGMCGKSTDFDITLLFRLLRTICHLTPPATGWDKLPINADHSCEADLARIKYYRNSVHSHKHTMEITDSDFNNLWREISEALLRIAGTISTAKRDEWKESIKKLFHDPLTPDAERYAAELQSWYKKDNDIKDEVEKLGNTIMEQLMKDKQEVITILDNKLQEQTTKHNYEMQELKKQNRDLQDLIKHVISILITVASIKPGGLSITQSQFPNTPLVQHPGRQSESACIPGPIPPEQPQTEGAVGVSSSWQLQQNDPTDPKIWDVILSSPNVTLLKENLEMTYGVDFQDSKCQSLVITVSCSSLEVLEGLWTDHCTGHLNEMVQETLVTAEVLQELCLSELKLKTIISEKEYKACKELFTEGNENLQQLTREIPSATTTSTSDDSDDSDDSFFIDDSDENESLEIQEATSQGNENLQQLCAEETNTRETSNLTTSTSDDSDDSDDSDENESLEIQEAASQGAMVEPITLDNRPVSDTALHDIGSGLGTSWKRLGRCLGIPEKGLETIDLREHDKKRKGILMLDMWKETWGEYATGVVLQESLEEIGRTDLSQKGTVMEPTSLENTPISHKLLDDLVEYFNPNWKIVGRRLWIPEDTITNIDMENQRVEEKYVAMLNEWKRRRRDKATVEALSEALENVGRSDLSKKVKGTVMEPTSLENTPVSRELLDDLAETFNPSWKIVGRHLGIPEDALTNIDMENRREVEKYVAMLDNWKKSSGDAATVRVLSEALEKAGRIDLANKIKGVRMKISIRPEAPTGVAEPAASVAYITKGTLFIRGTRSYNADNIPEQKDIAESGYVMTINNYSSLQRTHEEKYMEYPTMVLNKLKRLFQLVFGFRLKEHKNLTKSALLKKLTHTAKKDFSTYDCFVCVIQSEGSKDGILGIDDEVIKLETIASLFTRNKCPSLDGKPKIFLIEAWERHQTDKGPGSGPPPRPVISEDDFLIWYAPRIHDPRIHDPRSFFETPLRSLVYTLSDRNTSSRDFMEILMEVNKEGAESNSSFPPPYLVSTLTKKVFLKRK